MVEIQIEKGMKSFFVGIVLGMASSIIFCLSNKQIEFYIIGSALFAISMLMLILRPLDEKELDDFN